jgi:hypothetical protein
MLPKTGGGGRGTGFSFMLLIQLDLTTYFCEIFTVPIARNCGAEVKLSKLRVSIVRFSKLIFGN